MGVAGVAIMFAFYYLYKSVVSLVQYFAWSSKDVVGGRIGPWIRTEDFKKGQKNVYELYLGTNQGVLASEYEEILNKNETSKIHEGDALEFYYNPANQQHRLKSELSQALWMNPLLFGLCIVIIIACFALANAIS